LAALDDIETSSLEILNSRLSPTDQSRLPKLSWHPSCGCLTEASVSAEELDPTLATGEALDVSLEALEK
jgi:hypothetical protein